ncbi:MAG: putative glycoside hydrolase [Lachnospiraceae bacterium]|nr:putative glycoside hydrolase [Lachnospiraceae bacterium]
MKKWMIMALLAAVLTGCQRYEAAPEHGAEAEIGTGIETGMESGTGIEHTEEPGAESKEESAEEDQSGSPDGNPQIYITQETGDPAAERTPVKVKGIYVSAYVAGTEAMMDEIIRQIDETELNAVVIDVKDDNGRITFDMDSPTVKEINAAKDYIPDMEALAARLKEHDIYMIARIPAFRDPYLAEAKPEWCCKRKDGSIFRDRNKLAWVNPYKKEVWDYLIEVAKKAGELGFDEIQFDYIRFCTEKGMGNVVFDEADTLGRDRQDIILEFVEYAYEELAKEGLFVSADVFGAVIGGGTDAELVGQDYGEMAGVLDYICPMIYPSHYGDGNFGIAHPDTEPYQTIYAALGGSKRDLEGYLASASLASREAKAAVVRPWLQDFTASYLKHHIKYGPEQVRAQIQAVYDAGYEEWILWSAAVKYHYDGLLPAEAESRTE